MVYVDATCMLFFCGWSASIANGERTATLWKPLLGDKIEPLILSIIHPKLLALLVDPNLASIL